MKNLFSLVVLFNVIFTADYALSATSNFRGDAGSVICISPCQQDNTGDNTTNPTPVTSGLDINLFVEGNLYLDLSLFNDAENNPITNGFTSFTADTLFISSFENTPSIPNISDITIFSNPPLLLNEVGNFLIFSDTPIYRGVFEATNGIFIGNYSSLVPIPIPSAILLFLPGLFLLRCISASNKVLEYDASRRHARSSCTHYFKRYL